MPIEEYKNDHSKIFNESHSTLSLSVLLYCSLAGKIICLRVDFFFPLEHLKLCKNNKVGKFENLFVQIKIRKTFAICIKHRCQLTGDTHCQIV